MVVSCLHSDLLSTIDSLQDEYISGSVQSVKGALIVCTGIHPFVSIGSHCLVRTTDERDVLCEVVGIDGTSVLLMPFTSVEGIGANSSVLVTANLSMLYPSPAWLGRVVNALGQAIDEKGALPKGPNGYSFRNSPPPAHKRQRIEGKIDLGVRAINTFLTCCKGQRLGVFAGSGIGKSMLVAMLGKYSRADVKVIGLVGERGRELQEFIEDYLGPEGLTNSIIVAATSDESALMRRQAAYTTLTIAEYFRDQGHDVLCMLDSVTRFCMAQREIGLSAGEPPASRGYTPSVFSELPQLLERAGPGAYGTGSITGLFSVLVEGDDHNEPISDAVRGILDGHVVLDRDIAERGRFPAINILRSLSRTMPQCNSLFENKLVNRARSLLSTYQDMAEMIRLGAYRPGSNPEVDEAIHYHAALEAFLHQGPDEACPLVSGYQQLADILHMTEDTLKDENTDDSD